ncbi:MAG TPA: hypothetical protein VFN35_14015, partial [Ktedonobacteraceae bacterium]|nr:hypothetical protein [Ktedonobacteraceae bacterium]
TSHLPTTEQGIQEQAAIDHKDVRPKEIRPKEEIERLEAQANAKTAATIQASVQQSATEDTTRKEKKGVNPGSRIFVLAEVVAGTALAFVVALFRQREKKR